MRDIWYITLTIVIAIIVCGLTLWLWREWKRERDFLVLALAVMFTVIMMHPVIFIVEEYQKGNAIEQVEIVQAEVVDKRYIPARTTIIPVNGIMVTRVVSAKYKIEFSSNEYIQTYDDKDLYDAFDIGDRINMEYITYTNEHNKIFSRDLRFPIEPLH